MGLNHMAKSRSRRKATPQKALGRPSKYKPAMCARVVELGRLGKSKAQIRRDLGIHHSTWGDWVQKHPAFSAAVKEAHELSQAWWEDLGQEGVLMGSSRFNAVAFIFQMKNRFPQYKDRQDPAFTGADGGPIVQEHRVPDLASIQDAREALKEFETSGPASPRRAPDAVAARLSGRA
jgi:hypothetical protein